MAPKKHAISAKKAAKPSHAKKATPVSAPVKAHAKKHPGKAPAKSSKQPEKQEKGKHLRRAFEHLSRVEAMQALGQAAAHAPIRLLLEESRRSIGISDSRHAADLLRAAEHLSFAVTTAAATRPPLSSELERSIAREFERKAAKTLKHAPEKTRPLGRLCFEALEAAHAAFGRRSFHEAMEFVRAAEVLAEIDLETDPKATPSREPLSRLEVQA